MNTASGHFLGIVEFRNIINAIKESYSLDYSNYAFTSLSRRFIKVMQLNNLNNSNELILRIRNDKDFYEIFLRDLAIEETEMFRDPALWREMKKTVFDRIISSSDNKIWVPDFTSGEELITLCIVLKELNLLDKVKIIATTYSEKNIERVKSRCFSLKKMEANMANYSRYNGEANLNDYYSIKNNEAVMDEVLFEPVEFSTLNMIHGEYPKKIKMVLYRNKMIYFNKRLQCQIVDHLYESLLPGSNLIIGIKETLDNCNIDKRFILINESERIYKRAHS